MSGGQEVTVGYKYYVGMHMVLCHAPVDNISEILVDGKTAWSGSNSGGSVYINAPNLFGGKSREGGISGTISIETGASTQPKNAYLQSKLGLDIPAFRGVLGVVLQQVYIGLNPYIKPWAFRVKRILNRTDGTPQWYPAKAAIGNNMNAAHIIYECLTDSTWGMGYPTSELDSAAFAAAADTLHSEAFGLSLLWSKSTGLDEFIKGILKHIDGLLFVSHKTGLFTLKLMRGGYDVSTLSTLDASNIQKISNYKKMSISELVNQITVSYTNPITGDKNSTTVQDIALIQQAQSTIGTNIDYPGITSSVIASKVAARDLRAMSTPLTKCTIYANRQASNLNVGDVFKFTWPRYGVQQLIMRVASIEFGDLGNNAIRIDCVEDVFAMGSALYLVEPTTAWSSPIQDPTVATNSLVIETPYYDIARKLGDVQAQALPSTAGYIQATAARPGNAVNARLYTKGGGSTYEDYGVIDFCDSAITTIAIDQKTTVISLSDFSDFSISDVGRYAIINSEIISIISLSETSITAGRGCLDTVPVSHSAGSRIYFADPYMSTDGIEYVSGETANVKILPTTGRGTLDINSAPELFKTIVARQSRPYPPGNVMVTGTAYPLVVSTDLLISWSHRSRTQQTTETIYATTYGNIGPEAGTTYSLEIRDFSTNTLLDYIYNTNSTSFSSSVYGNGSIIKVLLWSIRDGLTSFQTHNIVFTLYNQPNLLTEDGDMFITEDNDYIVT